MDSVASDKMSAAELNIRLASIERALNLQAETLRQRDCTCMFTHEEIVAVKDLMRLLSETKSNILKGLITALVGGVLLLMVLGVKVWSKQ